MTREHRVRFKCIDIDLLRSFGTNHSFRSLKALKNHPGTDCLLRAATDEPNGIGKTMNLGS
jgi:hypothetical protein